MVISINNILSLQKQKIDNEETNHDHFLIYFLSEIQKNESIYILSKTLLSLKTRTPSLILSRRE